MVAGRTPATIDAVEEDSHASGSVDQDTLKHALQTNRTNCSVCTGNDSNKHSQTNVLSKLPPPLPEPVYSVRRRLLPVSPDGTLIALNSTIGKKRFLKALTIGTAASYLSIAAHSVNQSEPAYCGVTTALICLNALECDLQYRWKGGWRYWADESVLLAKCPCLSPQLVQRVGITVTQFQRLLQCQGLVCHLARPDAILNTLEHFRAVVKGILTEANPAETKPSNSTNERDNSDIATTTELLVVSFSRDALGQTGDGHFSPVTAYHADSDSVLVHDVARYKYPPYWVSVPRLYDAMTPIDEATGESRGWFSILNNDNVKKDDLNSTTTNNAVPQENRRPAHLVPQAGTGQSPCPIHPITIEYCPNNDNDKQ